MSHAPDCHDNFLTRLAQPGPDPGGGSASAFGAMIGLAILEKVCRVEKARADTQDNRYWEEILPQVRRFTAAAADLVDEDSRSYDRLSRARNAETAADELRDAVLAAVACPQSIMELATEALDDARRVACRCKRHLVPDVQVACEFLGAALNGAHAIAVANLVLVPDEEQRASIASGLRETLSGGREALLGATIALKERIQ
jgi:formiminotetrahydrofolate cyclodeaminase